MEQPAFEATASTEQANWAKGLANSTDSGWIKAVSWSSFQRGSISVGYAISKPSGDTHAPLITVPKIACTGKMIQWTWKKVVELPLPWLTDSVLPAPAPKPKPKFKPKLGKHHGSDTVSAILAGSQKLVEIPTRVNTGGGTGQLQAGTSLPGIGVSQVEPTFPRGIESWPPILMGNMHSQQTSVIGLMNLVEQRAHTGEAQVEMEISRIKSFKESPSWKLRFLALVAYPWIVQ